MKSPRDMHSDMLFIAPVKTAMMADDGGDGK